MFLIIKNEECSNSLSLSFLLEHMYGKGSSEGIASFTLVVVNGQDSHLLGNARAKLYTLQISRSWRSHEGDGV